MLLRCVKVKLLVLACLSILCIPADGQAQSVLRIAAVVNDDVISAHDLGQRIRLALAGTKIPNTPAARKQLTSRVLRVMIDERLKAQEAERQGVTVSDERLKKSMAAYARSVGSSVDQLPAKLAQVGVEIEVVEDQAIAEIGWAIAIQRSGGERIKVLDQEVDLALSKIEENKGKPEYLYSEILIPVETAADDASARQVINSLVQNIKAGSPFSALAREFSQSASAPRGGDLGWVQSGNIPVEIETILQATPTGGYTNPIRTPSGYLIAHLRDKRISGSEDRDDILSIGQAVLPITPDIDSEALATRKNLARTIATQANSCKELVDLGKQYGSPASAQVNGLALSKMPVEIRQAVAPLSVGEKTIVEQKGRGILALMICDRKQPAPVPEIAKRKKVRQDLRREKIEREQRRVLQKLRRAAFVDIRL